MTFKLSILPSAALDFDEIYSYYKIINPQIATDFKTSSKINIERLHLNPYLFQIKYDTIRVVRIDGFPYLIHYEIFESNVILHAILHASRDSKKQ